MTFFEFWIFLKSRKTKIFLNRKSIKSQIYKVEIKNNRIYISPKKVHDRLCDNIDTSGACLEMRNIVSATNKYLAKVDVPNARLLQILGEYVTKMLKVNNFLFNQKLIRFSALDVSKVMNSLASLKMISPVVSIKILWLLRISKSGIEI